MKQIIRESNNRMYKVICIILVLCSQFAISQPTDLYTNKSIAIPSENQNKSNKKKEEAPSLRLPKIDYNKRSFSKTSPSKAISFMRTDSDLIRPGQRKAKELKAKVEGGANIDVSVYKRHLTLGEIRYNGDKIVVLCRDFGMEDGDLIQIYVNDKIVKGTFTITNFGVQVHIPLTKGFNHIEFQAVNMGIYAPNTAGFIIRDQDNKEILLDGAWNLAKGFKAKVLIVKE